MQSLSRLPRFLSWMLSASLLAVAVGAMPAQKFELGTRVDGDKVYVTQEASAPTKEQAERLANEYAFSEAMKMRRARVSSKSELAEQESSKRGSSFESSREVSIDAEGVLGGAHVLEVTVMPGHKQPTVRLTLVVPRERLDPGWKIKQILLEPVPEPELEREKATAWRRNELRSFAGRTQDVGDFDATVMAFRIGMQVDPCADFAIDWAWHYEGLGDVKGAITTLERLRDKMPENELPRLKRQLRRLRGGASFDVLKERLRRIMTYAEKSDMRLSHDLQDGRATFRDKFNIKGHIPANQALFIAGLDGDELSTPRSAEFRRSVERNAGSGRLRQVSWGFNHRKLVGGEIVPAPEEYIPGEAVLIFLSQGPNSPPPPLLDGHPIDITLCTAKIPDKRELERLEEYIANLSKWFQDHPENQGQIVSWMQVQRSARRRPR